jgi:hypothetical protein
MTISDLTVRPIRFTARLDPWRRVVETLGGVVISEHPGWIVFQMGSGRLALHAASAEQPPGTALALETTVPLAEAVELAAQRGVPIALGETDHGTAGIVRAPDGTTFTLDIPTPAPPGAAATLEQLTVLQLWYSADTSMVATVLEGVGARRRIVGDDHGWIDFTCAGGGLSAAHRDRTPRVELAFEWDGDVEDVQALLAGAGIPSAVIDESYGRTVQIKDPDGGAPVWVNEKQTDLYGYRAVGPG